MKEARREIYPDQISPSNVRETRGGFLRPFSSNRIPLTAAEHVITQLAKETDKKRLPKNSMPKRIALLVKGHPLAMLEASLAIGMGTYGIYTGVQHLNPPSSIDINSIGPNSFNDTRLVPRAEAETKKVNPEEVFNPYAERGVIGDKNILRGVPLETIQNAPQFDEEGNPLFLIVTPKQGEVSHFEKKLSEGGILPDILEQVKAKGVKNILEVDNIAKDTPIPMPLDGYVFLMIVDRADKPTFTGVKVEFMTPNNTLDFVNITTTDNRTQTLVDAPRISPENHNGRDYTKGLFLKRGVPIMGSLIDGNTVDYFRQSGENGTLTTNRRIPGDILPLTIKDPLTGERKLPAQ